MFNVSSTSIPEQLQNGPIVTYLDLTNATIMDKVAIETGFVETNEWLRWLIYTAQNNKPNTTNCLACAAARPGLGTVPFPLNQNDDPDGFQCMIRLFNSPNPSEDCTTLHYLFPPTPVVLMTLEVSIIYIYSFIRHFYPK
uniref:Uncharacterized protein n=1 Tax=Seriola dumerili TaxID=41447 RepID=A0A3B4VN67_SERDU